MFPVVIFIRLPLVEAGGNEITEWRGKREENGKSCEGEKKGSENERIGIIN